MNTPPDKSSCWPFNSPALGPSAAELAEDRRAVAARLHRSYLNLVKEMRPLQAAWDADPQAAFVHAASAGWALGAHWRADDAPLYDAPFWTAIAPLEAGGAVSAPAAGADTAPGERLVRRRDAVLALPSMLAAATVSRAQVAAVLEAFDAGYLQELAGDEDFGAILAALGRDECVRTCMAYAGLLVTSVPPNFYAFVAGKGAPCLMLEVLVLAASALVCSGNATAVRIWQIEERFDELDMALTPDRTALNIDAAAGALVRMLDDFRRAAGDVHALLEKAGSRRFGTRASTTLTAEMAAIVADTACRDCGSSEHTTPLFRRGTVRYE